MKNWKITFYLFAVSPVLYVVSLFTFYFHSAIQLGFFPSYSQPDPKEIEVYEIYQPIILTFLNIWFVSLLIWIPLVLIYWLNYLKKTIWKPILISAICFLIAFLSIFTGVTEWFAD